MIAYFIINDCYPAFNHGDMLIMRQRITLMIMSKCCSVIDNPVTSTIQTRQNHCDEHMILHQALKQTSRGSTNTNSPNHQHFSVTIPAKSVRTLQESLDERYINEWETVTVQCPIVGCNGLQPLKIGIEKLPSILVLEIAATVDGRDETLLSCIEDIESKLTI